MKPVLIVPAAGMSTRYGLTRPKFLLQHPEGRTMLAAGLSGLPGEQFDHAVIVSLHDFFHDLDLAALVAEVEGVLSCPVNFVLLDSPTPSMVATVTHGLATLQDDRPVVIKDTDNLVGVAAGALPLGENFVTYASLHGNPDVVADNKSYVELDSRDFVTNIVEKRVISSDFNSGLVGFASGSVFLTAARSLTGASEIYVSDIIRAILADGTAVRGVAASTYIDWGTLEDWRRYCRSFATLFVDLDGVVGLNEHPLAAGEGGWHRIRPIQENVDALLQRQDSDRYTLIFTTSRSGRFRAAVDAELRRVGFDAFQLVMDLPHARRILINDFAPTNAFPSAEAINIPRNARWLDEMLPPAETAGGRG